MNTVYKLALMIVKASLEKGTNLVEVTIDEIQKHRAGDKKTLKHPHRGKTCNCNV